MPLSNNVIGAINFIAVLLSVPIIGAGIWLASERDNACVNILQWPVIILGILILVVALAGFIGGFWRIPWFLFFYLVTMLLLIILLVTLVAFTYAVTERGSGHIAPSRAYLEYRLEDYSVWLRRRVQSSFKWDRIRPCLASANMCGELNGKYELAQDFFNAHIGPIQTWWKILFSSVKSLVAATFTMMCLGDGYTSLSGCCKPPTQCGFTFVNLTYWISPISPTTDKDCLLWSNEQTRLCYACDSCKAGLLENLKLEWRRADLILLIALIALVIVYVCGCCAFRNAKTEELFRRYKQGYF